jgi:hypothetical protein
LPIGSFDVFRHTPRRAWICSVLRGNGLLRTDDIIEAVGPDGLLAAAAATAFISRHKKDQDGAVELRISSPNGDLDFVARVTWWPPSCIYRSAYADWNPT